MASLEVLHITPEKAKDFDHILIELKTGRWNIFHLAAFFLSSITFPQLMMAGTFMSPNTEHICDVPMTNTTNIIIDECSYSINETADYEISPTVKCDQWIFVDNNTSLTTEFSLVCDRSYLRPTFQTATMFGALVGASFNGFLADSFGRKTLIIIGAAMVSLLSLLISFMNDFKWVLALRYLTGLFIPCLFHSAFVLCMELLEPKIRSPIAILFAIPWALGQVWMGIVSYLIRDWRWLQRAYVLPTLLFIPLLIIIDESPRWLLVTGSFDRLHRVIRKAMRWNRSTLSEEVIFGELKKLQKLSLVQSEKVNISHRSKSLKSTIKSILMNVTKLCRTPEVRRRTLIMYFMHFACQMVYYGLTLNAVNYNLDPYLYMVVMGLIEIPTYILTIPIIAKFGRVKPLICSQAMCGISILVLGFIKIDAKWIVITLALIGKFSISASASLVYLLDVELLPTEVKVQIIGTALTIARFGGIAAPYVIDLAAVSLPWFPPVLFGGVSLISVLVAWFIPETLNCHFYETIAQLEQDTVKARDKGTKKLIEEDFMIQKT